jgi:hypothetical protein
MKRGGILGALVLAASAILISQAVSRPPSRTPFLLGGIQVNEPDDAIWFQTLLDTKMNTVAVTVYAKQGDWDSDNLWFDDDESGLIKEIRGAKARGLHVVLILRVALDHAFLRNRFIWHGLILPKDDELLDSWFVKYGSFVTKWARVAEAEGVDVFGIGSEMNAITSTASVDSLPNLEDYYLNVVTQELRKTEILSHQGRISSRHLYASGGIPFEDLDAYLEAQTKELQEWARTVAGGSKTAAVEHINRRRSLLESHWRELIGQVRRIYTGDVTYAANFDQYQDVTFWDALDVIGVNAYFPLRRPDASTEPAHLEKELTAGWRNVLRELQSFRATNDLRDRPFLFTEIGYTYRKNTTLAPWARSGFTLIESTKPHRLIIWDDEPVDFTERAAALRALYEANQEIAKELGKKESELIAGLLYWKLSTQPSHIDIEPFVHIIGSSTDDPLSQVWSHFVE